MKNVKKVMDPKIIEVPKKTESVNEAFHQSHRSELREIFQKANPQWGGCAEVLALVRQLAPALSAISAAALAGDVTAQSVILEMASHSCGVVDNLLVTHRDSMTHFARARSLWPMLLGVHPESRETQLRKFKSLPLAERGAIRAPAKKHPHSLLKTPANKLVWFGVILLHLKEAPGLPPFNGSADAGEAWFNAVFAQISSDHKMDEKFLKGIGGSIGTVKQQGSADKIYTNKVKSAIRNKLKKAFKQVFRWST